MERDWARRASLLPAREGAMGGFAWLCSGVGETLDGAGLISETKSQCHPPPLKCKR